MVVGTRTLPALRLTKSPLIHVIGQVRISPIFSISKFLPDFQEKVRDRFPRFRKGIVNEIVFEAQAPRVEQSEQFEFVNKEETTSIVLSSDFVALHTTRYSVFEEFIETLMFALQSINDIARLGVIDRFGIRYIDLIKRTDDVSVNAFIKSSLHGLDYEALNLSDVFRRYEQFGKTKVGNLAIRFYEQIGQPMPIGLGAVGLTSQHSVDQNERIGLLDFDHFTDSFGEFEPDAMREFAWALHDVIDMAFRNAVTEKALEIWGAEHV